MNPFYKKADKDRIEFINACIKSDTPRLEAETYPEQAGALYDIPFECGEHKYDVYFPNKEMVSDDAKFEEAFFIIHGGAFVYGVKRNNQLFGMTLAIESGIPCINVDYTLMPDIDLLGMLKELLDEANEIALKYGIKKFHVTGDSAGGYLSFVLSMIMYSDKLREELKLSKGDYTLGSALPLCGSYRNNKLSFPGIYFEKSNKSSKLPAYMYDVGKMVEKFGAPKTLIVTGEEDFLRKDNEYLLSIFRKCNLPCDYYIGMNKDDRVMSHIFMIPKPSWPESQEVIRLMIKNAKD